MSRTARTRRPLGILVADGPNDAPGPAGNQNVTFVPFERVAA